MTVIWLIVWLLSSTPSFKWWSDDPWFIGLAICALIDLLGALAKD